MKNERNLDDRKESSSSSGISRRCVLRSAGGILAAAALPSERLLSAATPTPQGPSKEGGTAATDLTGQLARYMVEARDRALPANVTLEAKHHILDTLGAMVSGSRLKGGEMAIAYVKAQGGVPEASVICSKH